MADNTSQSKPQSRAKDAKGVEPGSLPKRPSATDSVAAWMAYADILESRLVTGEETEDPRELAAQMTARR